MGREGSDRGGGRREGRSRTFTSKITVVRAEGEDSNTPNSIVLMNNKISFPPLATGLGNNDHITTMSMSKKYYCMFFSLELFQNLLLKKCTVHNPS